MNYPSGKPSRKEKRHATRRRSRRLRWIVIGIVALFAALQAKPVYREFKEWRAAKFAAQAEEFIRRKDDKNAYFKLQSALSLSPFDPKLNRTMSQLLARHNQREAVPFLRTALLSKSTTLEDRHQFILLAIRLDEVAAAREELANVLAIQPRKLSTLLIAAKVRMFEDRIQEAIQFAREALILAPDNETAQYTLALLIIRFNMPDPSNEARRLLWGLSGNDQQVGYLALLELSQLPDLSEDERARLQKIVKAPDAPLLFRLIGAELDIRYNLLPPATVVRELVQTYAEADIESIATVATWLVKHHAYAHAIQMIPLEKQNQRRDLFLIKIEALGGLGQWQEAYDLVREEVTPLNAFELEFQRARVSQGARNTETGAAHWRKLFAMAGTDPQRLKTFARWAESIGAKDEAVTAYEKLAATGTESAFAYTQLVRITEPTGNTRLLREHLARLAEIKKDAPEILNELAYANLLLQTNLASAKQSAYDLAVADPANPNYRLTLALALLRENKPSEAQTILEPLTAAFINENYRAQIICTAVWGANQLESAARNQANQILIARLKPEERQLIGQWVSAAAQ